MFIARIHTASLEIPAIRDGANLAVSVLAREPNFDVISFTRAKTEVACAKLYDAIWEFEFLQDRLSAAQHILMLSLAIFRLADRDEFNLIKLMLADHAFGIFPRRARFRAETRRMSRQAFREGFAVEDALTHRIG